MSRDLPQVSFIIPAKNEEAMLPRTLSSIASVVAGHFNYEVIVVDNGSDDNTVSIAKSAGAIVISRSWGSIGGLRNAAVSIAKGGCLVFIDADVSITQQWLDAFVKVLPKIQSGERMITGSRCSTDAGAGWIANAWFRRAPDVHDTTHVGTGHMIVGKDVFQEVGGFNESLVTGEDYDFCARARSLGASVVENQELKVIHYGVPANLREFMLREVWHGSGDVQSVRSVIQSTVAVLSIVFFISHVWMLIALLLDVNVVISVVLPAFIVLGIVIASAWKKYHYASLAIIAQNVLLYYFYFWGRALSVLNRFVPVLSSGTPRAGREK